MTFPWRSSAVLVGLLTLTTACSSHSATADPNESSPPVDVSVAPVDHREWATFVEAGGVLRARTSAVVSSRLLAPVLAVHVRAGDRVRRGQVLIELDAAAPRAEAARATASVDAARLSADAAAADLAGAKASLTLARATHDRIRRLHDTRSATPQELDDAVAALAAADARATAAHASRAAAGSVLEAARAGAEAGGIVAGYGRLLAPFDGVIARRDVDPGTMATPGVPLLVIDDANAPRLEVDLDATRVAGIGPGHAALVRIDRDGSAAPWVAGRVAEVARLDSAAPAFRVRIDVTGLPAERAGLFGRARLPAASRDAVTAPAAAIVQRGQLTLAFVVGADAVARLRTVRTGDRQDDRVEIVAGLTLGEQVVLHPAATLADGTRVRASAAPAPGAGR